MALDFPASPTDGQVYGNFIWSSSTNAWKSKPSTSTVTIHSSTAPTSANAGDVWFNTNDGTTFTYYDDGNTKQWIELISSGIPAVPISVINGGTGATSFTSGTYLKGSGTSAITTQAVPIPVTDGGTGATSAASALTSLGASPLMQYGEYTLPTFSVATSSTTYPTGTPSLANGSANITSKVTANAGSLTLQPGIWSIGLSYTYGSFNGSARTFVVCSFNGVDLRASMPVEEVQTFGWPTRRITSAQNLSFGFFQAYGTTQNLTLYRTYLTWLGPAN